METKFAEEFPRARWRVTSPRARLRACMFFGPPSNCIFSLFNATPVLEEDFRKQTGGVPAGKASALKGLSKSLVVL